ncbi:hypothetical protein RND71_014390 [Anisodus tanguticus]|uniref:Uncharacterized protein ycf68 n=1 Tax=Anisodus tanguticus TaxID=243964 RepID=A0AAE1SAJ5_9SOLA|nr:hypothetical protein RND71_014390 [Anisodus tanguticus]
MRIDGAIRVRSNVDPTFDSLVGSGRGRIEMPIDDVGEGRFSAVCMVVFYLMITGREIDCNLFWLRTSITKISLHYLFSFRANSCRRGRAPVAVAVEIEVESFYKGVFLQGLWIGRARLEGSRATNQLTPEPRRSSKVITNRYALRTGRAYNDHNEERNIKEWENS